MNLAHGDSDEVVIGRPGEAIMSLGLPVTASDGSGMRVPLGISAGSLSVQTMVELEAWGGGPTRFVAYFDDLAASWRGWAGAKEWSDDGPSVSMSATHDGIGLVSLVVSASPFYGWDGPGSWELRVVVPVEPCSRAPVAEKIRFLVEGTG